MQGKTRRTHRHTAKYNHPTALTDFYRTQGQEYRTSHENTGFIGHMYVSVLNVYTSVIPGMSVGLS